MKRTFHGPEPKRPKPEAEKRHLSTYESSTIKNHYFGAKQSRRHVSNEFHFDWQEDEDDDPMADLVVHRYAPKDIPLAPSKSKSSAQSTQRDLKILRESHHIQLKGDDSPPISSWSDASFHQQIAQILLQQAFSSPTPIQMQAIPTIMTGKDILALSPTGSGKTLAFSIPILQAVMDAPPLTFENKYNGPYALIVSPTRELSQQTVEALKPFTDAMGLKAFSMVGGKNVHEQSFLLRDGAHIISATPGRLKDLLQQQVLALLQCKIVVLDECDRMIDMGFQNDVNSILSSLTRKPQTLFFSATLPNHLKALVNQYLQDPACITIGEVNQASVTIQHKFVSTKTEQMKKQELLRLIKTCKPPIIVFVNMKARADTVMRHLKKANIQCTTLHSNKNQEQREKAISSFREGKIDVLVTTDVSGRGIDVKGVTTVVNYDMPTDLTQYTHRVGRTGREGKGGLAVSFLNNEDKTDALKAYLTQNSIPIPTLLE